MTGDDQRLRGVGGLEQLVENRTLQLRMQMGLRFFDTQQRIIALVLRAAPCKLGQFQRNQNDIGRT